MLHKVLKLKHGIGNKGYPTCTTFVSVSGTLIVN